MKITFANITFIVREIFVFILQQSGVKARKADGKSDLAKQMAAAKMATAAVQALDGQEPQGSFYDLIYNSLRGALMQDTEAAAASGASAAAAPSDVEVTVEQRTS